VSIPHKLSPWWIVGAGAAVRAIVLARTWEPSDAWRGDPRTYSDILEGLLAGRIDPATWIWPPAFPIAAAPIDLVFGPAVALHAIAWISGVATLALLVACGRWLRRPLPFGVAAFVLAFHPEAVLASARPLPGAFALLATVGAAAGLEASARGRGGRWAAAGGVAAAAAALSRPETAASIPLYATVALAARRSSARAVALWVTVAAVAIAPYAVGFRNAAGTWGLSLKPHLNVLKLETYAGGADFGERRVLWDSLLERFADADGRLDPRRVVEASDAGAYFLRPRIFRTAAANFAYAFRRDPLWSNLLWLGGLAGLAVGRGAGRERLYAVASATPVLAVAALFPPVERYALVVLPALGLGAGFAIERLRPRLRRVPRPVRAAAVCALAGLGAVEAVRASADAHWTGRYGEFLAAQAKGDLAEAEVILREAMRLDPGRPEPHEHLASLLRERGDGEGAVLRRAAGSPDAAVREAAEAELEALAGR